MEKRNEMLQNVLSDKDRIFDLKLFWFEMICSQLSDWNIKQIWLQELPSQLAGWWPEATVRVDISEQSIFTERVLCLYYYDQDQGQG